jgi:hypothetical protein
VRQRRTCSSGYASQDAAVAAALVEALERHGVACRIAPRDVEAGALYADAIVHAIDAAHVVVLILSQRAAAFPHILRESSARRSRFRASPPRHARETTASSAAQANR